jgi:hypothetical protein
LVRLPFEETKLRSASIFIIIEVVFHKKNIEVVFQISFSWDRIRLHTKNRLTKLPVSGLKCNHIHAGGDVVVRGLYTNSNTTPTKLCFIVGWIVAILRSWKWLKRRDPGRRRKNISSHSFKNLFSNNNCNE